MESFNRFPEIAKAFGPAISQVVRKVAFDIQAGAAHRAPVDTGFLRNSIYTVTSEGSTYAQKLEKLTTPSSKPTKSGKPRKLSKKAQVLKAKMETDLLNEIAVDPGEKMVAYVAVGAEYGIYVEMGTRHMTAKPYFYPAVEHARSGFEHAMSKIEDKLKEVTG